MQRTIEIEVNGVRYQIGVGGYQRPVYRLGEAVDPSNRFGPRQVVVGVVGWVDTRLGGDIEDQARSLIATA